MKLWRNVGIVLISGILIWCVYGTTKGYGKEEKKPATAEAKPINADASVTEEHPAIEEGITCNDCHEINLDAYTTATEAWLAGDYLKWKAGEGIMPKKKVWERVVEIFKGKGAIPENITKTDSSFFTNLATLNLSVPVLEEK